MKIKRLRIEQVLTSSPSFSNVEGFSNTDVLLPFTIPGKRFHIHKITVNYELTKQVGAGMVSFTGPSVEMGRYALVYGAEVFKGLAMDLNGGPLDDAVYVNFNLGRAAQLMLSPFTAIWLMNQKYYEVYPTLQVWAEGFYIDVLYSELNY